MTLASIPEVAARFSFSGETTEGRARVIERSASWRRTSALRELLWLLLAPAAFLIPPHIPWVILVIGFGLFRAFNRAREYRTLVALQGACPKCGAQQEFAELGRMRNPHKVQCSSCRWTLTAEVAHGVEA
ncbi:MAG TPA: hypothetical protein VE913_16545 [Longimicrobium sp.]|nr:hypothetical protein [Longimicrobium sp.]